jgi:GNAT superfamily N-acetyltransferase
MTEPSDSTPVIRDARRDDLERIVEMFELGSLVPGKELPSDLRPYAAAWPEIEAGLGGLLVAEVDDLVLGACQLIVFRHLQSRGGRCAEIESVHVHPDYRGRGIGHVLVQGAIERARALGCYRVQLTSNLERADAHRFYESLGLVASHRGFKLSLHQADREDPKSGLDK